MGAWRRYILACVAVAASAAHATGPRPLDVADQATPAFTVFTSKDGLSDEIWSTVGFGPDGFAWAGSASELARFDGYRWQRWPQIGARSLVRDMETDAAGRLWALFEREGTARLEGGRWIVQADVPGFVQRFSRTWSADGTLQLWAGHEHGLARLVGDAWVEDAGNGSLPAGQTIAVARTETLFGEAREWVAVASAGLWFRPAGVEPTPPWQPFEHPGIPGALATDLVRTVDRGVEELWLLAYGAGLFRITAAGVRRWRAEPGGLPTEALYSAVATRSTQGDRQLWIASRAGLVRMRGESIAVFDRSHGLPSDAIRGIKLQQGRGHPDLLWMATEAGIARTALADSPWQTVSLLGARENGVFALLLEPDGRGGERLWVGSSNSGVALLEGGHWRMFDQASGTLPAEGVRGIWRVPAPDGGTWRLMALSGGALLRVDDAHGFHPIETPWPKTQDAAAVAVLPRQRESGRELWFATQHAGVHRLDARGWTSFPSLGDGATWAVTGLAEQVAADGTAWLWAAGSRGLARFDGTAWTPLATNGGLPADRYRSVALFERNGRTELWAGSNRHGIVRLDVDDPARPVVLADAALPAPPDPTVYSVLEDSQGRLYVCTNNGVQQLTPRVGGGWHERVFRRGDGLVHDECNTNAQFIDGNDRYWVGTLGGLSMHDASVRLPAAATTPRPLRVTSVRVDGSPAGLPDGGALELPPGSRELRIDYTLLTGIRETETLYRTRLAGFEPTPGEWTPEHGRSFTGLPPGQYTLEVEARDWSGTPARPLALSFALQPYWWQRTSVRTALLALLLLATTGIGLFYIRSLRLRQRVLERAVRMRTTALRAANQQLTTLSYVDPLTGIANRRRVTEALDTALARARQRGSMLGLVLVDVDHFKAYNDRHGHLAGDAALRAVARALEDAARERDLVGRFGGEEFACVMEDVDEATAAGVAERMRNAVAGLPPRSLGNSVQTITLSAGVACRRARPGDTASDLLREADTAMYRAKAAGRNRICLAGPVGASPG